MQVTLTTYHLRSGVNWPGQCATLSLRNGWRMPQNPLLSCLQQTSQELLMRHVPNGLIIITFRAPRQAPSAASSSAASTWGRCFEPYSVSIKQPFRWACSHQFVGRGVVQIAVAMAPAPQPTLLLLPGTAPTQVAKQWASLPLDLPRLIGGHLAFCHA